MKSFSLLYKSCYPIKGVFVLVWDTDVIDVYFLNALFTNVCKLKGAKLYQNVRQKSTTWDTALATLYPMVTRNRYYTWRSSLDYVLHTLKNSRISSTCFSEAKKRIPASDKQCAEQYILENGLRSDHSVRQQPTFLVKGSPPIIERVSSMIAYLPHRKQVAPLAIEP